MHQDLPACVHFENYSNLSIRRFHTWQAGHEGTQVAFLPKMINHTWQAMHRGTLNAKSEISLSGKIPNPLTISKNWLRFFEAKIHHTNIFVIRYLRES